MSDEPTARSFELSRLDGTTVAGALDNGESVVLFESTSLDQRTVALHLEVNGAPMDFTYDVQGVLTEDGHLAELAPRDLTALLDLRDAMNTQYTDVVENSLQGMFLSRHADWLADAPAGYTVETREVDVRDKLAVANTTNDDSIYNTCLRPGYNYTAYYDAGNGGQQWQWTRTANSGSCLGRCGAGCNFLDTDLMLDCFEHDTCVDHFGGSSLGGNANCGDEFSHAVAEYTATMGAWCPY
ncbi:MAG: hypothetical protein IPL61_23475 [Myxococcales bacterium]|nr:hypothetical protein [Myxococcales bacterium]